MSSGKDTPMARFLLSILKQMPMKDVDWEQVANDPILAEPITNGHAARMRFSRFRASIMGVEPQKRNRTANNKNRVTKPKKDGKTKKTKDDDSVKGDDDSQVSGGQDATSVESQHVKRERSQMAQNMAVMSSVFNTTAAPMSAAGMHSQLQARLLTPCSDSDAMGTSPNYGASPGSDILHADTSYDFAGPSSCVHGNDQMSWSHGNSYPSFGVNFLMNPYSNGSSDQHGNHAIGNQPGLHHQHNHHAHLTGPDFGVHPHQHQHQHSQFESQLHGSQGMMESDEDNRLVKHEDWDRTAL